MALSGGSEKPQVPSAISLAERQRELNSLIAHHQRQIDLLMVELEKCHLECGKARVDWMETCIGDVLEDRLVNKLDRAGYFQVKDLVQNKSRIGLLLRLTKRECELIDDLFERLGL